jgi:hypothetical protein
MGLAVEPLAHRVAKRAGRLRNGSAKSFRHLPAMRTPRHIIPETGRGKMSELWRA